MKSAEQDENLYDLLVELDLLEDLREELEERGLRTIEDVSQRIEEINARVEALDGGVEPST